MGFSHSKGYDVQIFMSEQIRLYELDYTKALEKISDKYGYLFDINYTVKSRKEVESNVMYYEANVSIVVTLDGEIFKYFAMIDNVDKEESERLAFRKAFDYLLKDKKFYSKIDEKIG